MLQGQADRVQGGGERGQQCQANQGAEGRNQPAPQPAQGGGHRSGGR